MMQGDDGLFGHCAQTGIFCVMIAARMEAYVIGQRSGMDPKQARDLVAPGLAGMFHDLGKLLLDEDTKSRRQIDEAFDTEPAPASYQKHVVAGYAALRNAPMPASARQAILNHHQRFDGSGFPDLGPLTNGRTNGTQSGKQIHIFARILAAANGLTHLIADAGDRPMVLALSKFVSPSLDGWYDPQVRHAIAAQMPPFPVGTMVKLSDGQPAVVATPCPTDPCRPTVRVLEGDEAGEMIPLAEQEHESLHIAEASGEPVAKHSYDLHTVLKREAEMIKQLFAEGAADAPR
jgi:HD-GYP domain-containing protein (c-di-GMP phosphodiesterase class II)